MDLILPDFGLLFWTGLVFVSLLFVLTKFIWKPILGAVNAREQKIAAVKMVEDAKNTAKSEAEKVLSAARQSIEAEKAAAIAELKTQVASFSLEIAEKVVRGELASDDKQKALAEKLAGDINMN